MQNPSFSTSTFIVKSYHPFGMVMPRRSFTSESYRYGFNGMEKDGEDWTGNEGSHLDFGARIYDSRLGRWQATDPLAGKYPWASPYCFVANKPIVFKDPDGRIIDWANGNLTSPQKISLLKLVNDLRVKSKLFDYIYFKLNQSPTIFTVNYFDPAGGSTKAVYRPKDNSINLNDNASNSSAIEEFFHAFQSLIYGNWMTELSKVKTDGLERISSGEQIDWDVLKNNNKGTNIGFIESEAKLMKYLIMNQIGEKKTNINHYDNVSGAGLGQKYFGSSFNRVISNEIKVGPLTMMSAQKDFYEWAVANKPATLSYTESNGIFINSKPNALNDVIENGNPVILDSPIERDPGLPDSGAQDSPQG